MSVACIEFEIIRLNHPVRKSFLFIYVLIGVVILMTDLLDLSVTKSLSRPLISGSLLFFYASISSAFRDDRKRKVLLASLFFAVSSDVVMIFSDDSDSLFITGMVLYLSSLLGYLSVYIMNILDSRPWGQHWSQFALSLFFLLVGVEFFVETNMRFTPFKVPVIILLLVLTLLMSAAALRSRAHDNRGYMLGIAGAACIFLANTLMLLDLFVTKIPYAGALMLIAYMAGQYLVVESIWRSISRLSPQIT